MDKHTLLQMYRTIDCPYLDNKGYCMRRDDTCKPYSLKCIKSQKQHMIYSSTSSGEYSNSTSLKYNPFTKERYGHNKNVTVLNKYNETPVLYVFKGFLRLDKNNTIDYQMIVRDIKTDKKQSVLVAYNTKTRKYYISDVQLKYLHKKGYFPNAIFITCDQGSKSFETETFNEFSKLSLYGYSVGVNGLTESVRRKILKHIIDNGIMKGYEIITHLRGLIALREDRTDRDFSVAIEEWKSDILFVSNNCKWVL